MVRYNSTTPPKYNLNKVVAPVYLYYSNNDWMCHETDSLRLCNELSSCQDSICLGNYSHMDYLFALNAPDLVYNSILKLMKK